MGRVVELRAHGIEGYGVAVADLATKLEELASNWTFRISRRARVVLTFKRAHAVEAIKVYYLEVPVKKGNYLVLYKRTFAAADYPPIILAVTEFAWFYENKEFSYEKAAREILDAIIDYETDGWQHPTKIVKIEVEPLGAFQL